LADTEAANPGSVKDDTTKEKELENSVDECCTKDSTLTSSVNNSSQKTDNSDTCLHTVANEHLPDVGTTMPDSKDSMPADSSEAFADMSKADADNESVDILTSGAVADTAGGGPCSAVLAVQTAVEETMASVVRAVEDTKTVGDTVPSSVKEQCAETDANSHQISSTAVPDCNEHQTEASGETKFEQTVTLADSDSTSADENRSDFLQSEAPDLSPHCDSDVKSTAESTTDLQTDLSHALMNEVNFWH